MLNLGVLKNVTVSTFRVVKSYRTNAAESGRVGNCGRRSPDVGGGRIAAKFGGARYISLPIGSKPGFPNGPPTRKPTSCARGAAMTRVIFPFGSITSIESDAGSTKSVESPR